jgi:hypothetical protein
MIRSNKVDQDYSLSPIYSIIKFSSLLPTLPLLVQELEKRGQATCCKNNRIFKDALFQQTSIYESRLSFMVIFFVVC